MNNRKGTHINQPNTTGAPVPSEYTFAKPAIENLHPSAAVMTLARLLGRMVAVDIMPGAPGSGNRQRGWTDSRVLAAWIVTAAIMAAALYLMR